MAMCYRCGTAIGHVNHVSIYMPVHTKQQYQIGFLDGQGKLPLRLAKGGLYLKERCLLSGLLFS